MTYAEILAIEDTNVDKIYLHRAGAFLHVFEHSAYFFHRYVHPFKLHRKFIKSVNRYVIYLEIPEAALNKWLFSYTVREVSERLLVCDFEQRLDEVSYQNWLGRPHQQ